MIMRLSMRVLLSILLLLPFLAASPTDPSPALPSAPATSPAPPPVLGIGINPSAKANGWTVFTSRVVYNEITDVTDTEYVLSDEQLVGLAKQAYEEMKGLDEYKAAVSKPSVMAALAIANEVFFSSSITNAKREQVNFIYDFLTQPEDTGPLGIVGMLASAQIWQVNTLGNGRNVEPKHRTQARCAEPMAMHQYNRVYPNVGFQGREARIAAWGRPSGSPGFVPACGDNNNEPHKWGCFQTAVSQGIRPIMNDPGRYPVFYEQSESRSQVSLC